MVCVSVFFLGRGGGFQWDFCQHQIWGDGFLSPNLHGYIIGTSDIDLIYGHIKT